MHMYIFVKNVQALLETMLMSIIQAITRNHMQVHGRAAAGGSR